MASASSASMVSRWGSLLGPGVSPGRAAEGSRELWRHALCLSSLQEKEAFTKTPCYHYFHCHCLARYIEHMERELQARGQEQERPHAATKQVSAPTRPCAHLAPCLTPFSVPPLQWLLTFLGSQIRFCLTKAHLRPEKRAFLDPYVHTACSFRVPGPLSGEAGPALSCFPAERCAPALGPRAVRIRLADGVGPLASTLR